MGIIAALIIGAIAGWLAGLIVRGAGFGLIGNIVVGIIGALVAGWLLPQIGVTLGGGTALFQRQAGLGGLVVMDHERAALRRLDFVHLTFSILAVVGLKAFRRPCRAMRR